MTPGGERALRTLYRALSCHGRADVRALAGLVDTVLVCEGLDVEPASQAPRAMSGAERMALMRKRRRDEANVTSDVTRGGEGGGLISDLQRDPDREGECERETSDARDVTSDDANVTTKAPERYRAAYEAGISGATKHGYAMPRKAEGELHQAILAHAKGLRGDALHVWIRSKAGEFARMVLALPEQEQRYWSNLSPVGLLRWLNTPPASATHRVAPKGPTEHEKRAAQWQREAVKDPQAVGQLAQGLLAAIGKTGGGQR